MKLEEIENEIAIDSVINPNKLSEEALKTPIISSKYRRYYVIESRVLFQAQARLIELEMDLFKYYNGEASEDEYRQYPINKLPLKGNIDKSIKSDKRYLELTEKVKNQELKVYTINDFMKGLTQRSFDIKNAIEWEKLKNGVN